MKKINYVISACLLGIPCRFNGVAKPNKKALKVYLSGKAIAVCPEIFAGLPTPRPACEIKAGEGNGVILGKAKIVDEKGNDFSKQFISGANLVLTEIIEKHDVKYAILKSGSPSCGVSVIYSGKFDGKKKKGSGVFSELLKEKKVKLIEVN